VGEGRKMIKMKVEDEGLVCVFEEEGEGFVLLLGTGTFLYERESEEFENRV